MDLKVWLDDVDVDVGEDSFTGVGKVEVIVVKVSAPRVGVIVSTIVVNLVDGVDCSEATLE